MPKKNYSWKVSRKDAKKKILDFLKEKLLASNRQVKKALDKGLCKVNGRIERFATSLLKEGALVTLSSSFREFIQEKKQKSIKILYEDEFFLAVDKPSNFECLDKNIHLFFPKKYLLIHRLDKDTTGVLLISKTQKFKEKMIKNFKAQKIQKTYLAWVDGHIKEKTKKIESNLKKIKALHGQSIYGPSYDGKYALTNLEVIDSYKDKTIVELKPITGRTHQLRAHMKQISHPILGDFLYAKRFICSDEVLRLQLHASEIEFEHPETLENIYISSEIPEDFLS
ncbi:MAG: Ribosomal large subunit pseudouridine synthase C [Candidatus Anoxychlamydiales bacterium]|nr:Ribosomal large subunit pseudouridine synthase C [Candidatus Anoxychlamydiales bacterium]NGX52293.1 Ribosomal large subunit pseudouridine synthase C [Candidatus Anoxychlamydiales bacterium]